MTIFRDHLKGDAASRAIYSPCERYRYLLWRDWGPGARRVGFVMLNPSTATERQNDPTVERCERRARALGFDGFGVANIFAYRATDPKVMRAQPDPVGPGNDAALADLAAGVEAVICGWGTHARRPSGAGRAGGGSAARRGPPAVPSGADAGRRTPPPALYQLCAGPAALGVTPSHPHPRAAHAARPSTKRHLPSMASVPIALKAGYPRGPIAKDA